MCLTSRCVRPIVATTVYDSVMAQLADQACLDLLLVGDSVGTTLLGFETTVNVTLEMMLHQTSAVARTETKALIVSDLPFGYSHDDFEHIFDACRKLIQAGADAVKFQKRSIEDVYTKEQLESYRESPWGKTFREQKEGIELNDAEYDEIDKFCKKLDIEWYASAWDVKSQLFLRKFNTNYNKVASAMLTNFNLLNEIVKEKNLFFNVFSYEAVSARNSNPRRRADALLVELRSRSLTLQA